MWYFLQFSAEQSPCPDYTRTIPRSDAMHGVSTDFQLIFNSS